MHFSRFFAPAALIASAAAQSKGFNYGSTNTDGSVRTVAQFEELFNTAKNVAGAPGFTSARLFTTIQGGTTNAPIEAIQAAINTNTTLLLGLWASAGEATVQDEIAALTNAANQYGQAFADLVVGISVGSEDLYRVSVVGIERSNGLPGASPDQIASYIGQTKSAIAGSALDGKLVGHVDTWTAWVNGSNSAVIGASDFIGFDGYPFYETDKDATIDNALQLFYAALDETTAASQGKPVWITETGWPTGGENLGLAVASVSNAARYWAEVGCSIFDRLNVWWFTLEDPVTFFGVVGSPSSTTPLYDLACGGSSKKRSVAFNA